MAISSFKKNLTRTLILIILSLGILPFSLMAQDVDTQEFISERGFFSVDVPTDWKADEIVPGAALLIANSDAAVERYQANDQPESGDLIVSVGFLPYNILQAPQVASLNIQYDASPDIFLQSLLPLFRIREEVSVGMAELVSVSDLRDAGVVSVSADEREGDILVFHVADRVVAFISTQGFLGETDTFQEFVYSIAASTEFTAPQSALWGVMVGQ